MPLRRLPGGSQGAPGRPREAPGRPPGGPGRPPGGPQEAPRGPQEPPRRPPGAPKRPQEAPKRCVFFCRRDWNDAPMCMIQSRTQVRSTLPRRHLYGWDSLLSFELAGMTWAHARASLQGERTSRNWFLGPASRRFKGAREMPKPPFQRFLWPLFQTRCVSQCLQRPGEHIQ